MALDGIRVIDWSVFQQGPVVGAMLGDLGAEVIKIEELGRGDPGRGLRRIAGLDADLPGGRVCYFEVNNRNKKSLALDLKKPQAQELIYRLVAQSDVFVQNFRVGVAERLGLDYDTLVKQNPKLIYASATGYGSRGPDSQRPSLDPAGVARTGFLDLLGDLQSEEPRYPPGGIADQIGAIVLAYGVLGALLARERLGVAQHVECSHLSSMLWLQSYYVHSYLMLGKRLPRLQHDGATNPMMNFYRCRDGRWLFLSLMQPERHWPNFCRAIDRLDLEHDPRFNNMERRAEHHQALIAELDKVFAGKCSQEWVQIFHQYPDFIYEMVNSVTDLPGDPQVLANDYIVDFAHPTLGNLKMLNLPVTFSETPGTIRLPAPECGQHTEEVLTEICGYSWDEVIALREAEVI